MPKAATKKKTAEPASRARHLKPKEKQESSELRDGDEDGLFVSQSPPPSTRPSRRLNANKGGKSQLSSSRMDEGDEVSNRGMEKHERAPGRRVTTGRKPNKLLDDFKKLVDRQNDVVEKEVNELLSRRLTGGESFLNTFHTTFTFITSDGVSRSRSGEARETLRETVETTLSKAHKLLKEAQNGLLDGSYDNINTMVMRIEEEWALNFKHTEKILEVGRLVGEDKINAKLSGLVPIVHDPDYSDASAALFGTGEEDDMDLETWATAAKNQGRVVKKMTAAIAEH